MGDIIKKFTGGFIEGGLVGALTGGIITALMSLTLFTLSVNLTSVVINVLMFGAIFGCAKGLFDVFKGFFSSFVDTAKSWFKSSSFGSNDKDKDVAMNAKSPTVSKDINQSIPKKSDNLDNEKMEKTMAQLSALNSLREKGLAK